MNEGNQDSHVNQLSDADYMNRMSAPGSYNYGYAPTAALDLMNENFNKEENERDHHTDVYDTNDVVVRRGRGWKFSLTFSRDVNPNYDVIGLQFVYGRQPRENRGTLLRLPLNLNTNIPTHSMNILGRWSAIVASVRGGFVDVWIYPPANALVGKYGVYVETMLNGDYRSVRRYEWKGSDLIVIFNPWVKEDVVYVDRQDERQEYVLNENGRMWIGDANSNQLKTWRYGQFDRPVLEVALRLMERAEGGDTDRRSPVSFTRALAALTNHNDDSGVVEGSWNNTFPSHTTSPWAWTGSVKILKEYLATGRPVKYGQCWVFAGVLTSLLRALGIPTRPISNFESGHDSNRNMTIDFHFNTRGQPIVALDDSIWNFHVWCESFFKRSDLPNGYDGWQVVDSTPQEPSAGKMRLGPTPVKAVKEGHMNLNYDVKFVMSEVNGDKVTWEVDDYGRTRMLSIDRDAIGKNMCTKSVGSNFKRDVTLDYKYPEGSSFRMNSDRSFQLSDRRLVKDDQTNDNEDVDFSLELPRSAQIGTDFDVKVNAVNSANEVRHINGRMTIFASSYTGVPGKRIESQSFELDLAPGKETTFNTRLTADMYLSKINPEATMQAYICFSVKETQQQFCRSDGFSLMKPLLYITIPGQVRVNQVHKCVASFTNTLPVALTNGVLNLDGGIITSSDVHNFNHAIQPGETVTFDFEILPNRVGRREISGTFTSDQLSGVDGALDIQVV